MNEVRSRRARVRSLNQRVGRSLHQRVGRVVAVTMLAVVGVASPLVALSASAAQITGAITKVTVTPTNVAVTDTLTTNIDWCVPNGTKAGDTFTLTIPGQFNGYPSSFALKDTNGSVVANATVSGTPATATFTMTQYAETHISVCGTAFFTANLNSSSYAGTTQTLTYKTNDGSTFSTAVTVKAPTGINRAIARKTGLFSDSTDQCRTNAKDCIDWIIETPLGASTSGTINDNLNSGQSFDCPTLKVLVGDASGANNAFAHGSSYSDFQVVSCTATSFKVTYGAVPAGKLLQLSILTNATAPDPNGAHSYSNTASVTNTNSTGTTTTPVSAGLKSAAGGGNGSGKQAVSVGDFVWVDTNKDGIQDAGEPGIPGVKLTITGPTGQPVTDINGNAVGPVTTDSNGKYDFTNLPVLPAGQHYTVTIDQSSAPLSPYVPTIAGAGSDTTKDSSTGSATSTDLTANGDQDQSLDFGFISPSVSVGDFVWVDTNKDGIQDAGEPGIPGVKLTITGPTGQPVTDINGNAVGPVTTDSNGKYDFTNLPVLPAGQHYTVTIDKTSPALSPYVSTIAGAGTDRAKDSSTGSATSTDLTSNGDQDLTLDFGFIVPAKHNGGPTHPKTPVKPVVHTSVHGPTSPGGRLPFTGADNVIGAGMAGSALLATGALLLLAGRRRSDEEELGTISDLI